MWTELDMCHLCSQRHPFRNSRWHASCIFNNFTFRTSSNGLSFQIIYPLVKVHFCLQFRMLSVFQDVCNPPICPIDSSGISGLKSGFSPSQAGHTNKYVNKVAAFDQTPQQHHENPRHPKMGTRNVCRTSIQSSCSAIPPVARQRIFQAMSKRHLDMHRPLGIINGGVRN